MVPFHILFPLLLKDSANHARRPEFDIPECEKLRDITTVLTQCAR